MGEKEQEFVMPWDEIKAVEHIKWIPKYDEKDVVSKSQKRIGENKLFQNIDENAKTLKTQTDETIVSLNYESFSSNQAMLDAQDDAYDKSLKDQAVQLDVKNLQVDINSFEADSVKTEINEKWLKNLRKDVTLEEAVLVIKDMKS